MLNRNTYIGYETLKDWIDRTEERAAIKEFERQEVIKSEKYQNEEKLGVEVYSHLFKSKHTELENIERQLNWEKQLLGFLQELKELRERNAEQ